MHIESSLLLWTTKSWHCAGRWVWSTCVIGLPSTGYEVEIVHLLTRPGLPGRSAVGIVLATMASTSPRSLLLLVLAVAVVVSDAQLQLSETFYDATCPQAASIVQQKVNAFVDADRGLAAALMRLHFHDCFVRVRGIHCFGNVVHSRTCLKVNDLLLLRDGVFPPERQNIDWLAGLRWVRPSQFYRHNVDWERSIAKQRFAARFRADRRNKDGARVRMPRCGILCRYFGIGCPGRHCKGMWFDDWHFQGSTAIETLYNTSSTIFSALM